MRKYRILYIIPFILSLLVTIGLVRLIPVLSTKYQLEVVNHQRLTAEDYRHYADLNGDGTSESVSLNYNAAGNLAVSVRETRDRVINQFNLPGQLLTLGPVLDIYDVNADGTEDILICTRQHDSLFLTLIDALYAHPTTKREFFIDRLNRMNEYGDYLLLPGQLSDLNLDGSPEYVFAVSGGHSLQPRRVYAVDFISGKVSGSPLSGAAVDELDLFDLDGDGRDEILLNTVATENFDSPFPYSDSVSWMMVLDGSLEFYRPPIQVHPAPSRISMEPFVLNNAHYLLVYQKYVGTEYYPSVLAIYDHDLKPVRSRQFIDQASMPSDIWKVPGRYDIGGIRIFTANCVYIVDDRLKVSQCIEGSFQFGSQVKKSMDINRDGEIEIVTLGGQRLRVFSADFVENAGVNIEWDIRRPRMLLSMIEGSDKDPLLFAQIGPDTYTLSYAMNTLYRYRFAVYPAIFLVLLFIFCAMVVIQKNMIERRYEKDRLIGKLQLQAIRNQLDPHFTFNALNAVGSLIYKEKKELAYEYLKGLTDLLRMVSASSSDITWSLEEELGFVRKYLKIEKLRFRDRFSYLLEVETDCQYKCKVPKLSILTFVENAIKHGLRHKQGDRRLEIRAAGSEKELVIQIKDNGIGRAAASAYPGESTGNGIEMMEAYFRQFNEVTRRRSRFLITDLYDTQKNAAGTLVEIIIQ